MTSILNPEPGRFICRGPGARVNADVLAGFERDRGLIVAVMDASECSIFSGHSSIRQWERQHNIASADVIIDVIP